MLSSSCTGLCYFRGRDFLLVVHTKVSCGLADFLVSKDFSVLGEGGIRHDHCCLYSKTIHLKDIKYYGKSERVHISHRDNRKRA